MDRWKASWALLNAGGARNCADEMRIGIALGSNLGDRLANLRAARKAIVDLTVANGSILVSRVYESDAVGCEPGAGKFLKAVLEITYAGDTTQPFQERVR